MTRLRCLVPTVMLIAVMPVFATAQPIQNSKRPPVSNPLRDRDAERLLKVGGELIQAKRYKSAIAMLQLLLKLDASRLFISPDGRNQGRLVGVQAEARRLLSTLPAGAVAIYEQKYGDKAKSLKSPVAVATQYPLTKAGIVAEYKLCDSQYRGGRPLPGALGLARLVKNAEARKIYGPLLHLEAAIAWARAGHRERAIDVLEDLRKNTKSGKIVVGAFHLTLYRKRSEAIGWLLRTVSGWKSFRRIEHEAWAQRAKPLSPSSADAHGIILGKPKWSRDGIRIEYLDAESQVRAKKAQHRLAELRGKWRRARYLTFPVERPRIGPKLVIHRAGGRIQALDRATGRIEWQTFFSDQSYARLIEAKGAFEKNGKVSERERQLENYLTQRAWIDVAATHVEVNKGVSISLVTDPLRAPQARVFHAMAPATHRKQNMLICTDNRTGKLIWLIGGPPGTSAPMSGAFFLGTPVNIDDRLVGLVEQDGRISLTTIQQKRRKVQRLRPNGTAVPDKFITLIEPKHEQTIPLLSPEWSIDQDPVRRFAGDRPIDAAGLIICPITNEGVRSIGCASNSSGHTAIVRGHSPSSMARRGNPSGFGFNRTADCICGLKTRRVAGSTTCRDMSMASCCSRRGIRMNCIVWIPQPANRSGRFRAAPGCTSRRSSRGG